MIVKDLRLEIAEKTIFKDINFSLEKGKITLLSGKSGIGKSSLIMCMCGIIPNTMEGNLSGSITLNDKEIIGLPTEKLAGDIAYVSQDADSQLCSFTVEEELIFALENFNYSTEDIIKKVDEVLSQLKILNLKYKSLNELSGGEKQKVVLASILVFSPDIILVDEPTANLDPKATKEILKQLDYLSHECGKTILLIEHKLKEVADIVDNILEMNFDKVVAIDKEEFIKSKINENSLSRLEKRNLDDEEILSIEKLNFSYKEDIKLKDISLSIKKGEILGITGYNGAGKSTLMKLIMGLLKPQSGIIKVEGNNIKDLGSKKIGNIMGMSFQNPEHQFIKMSTEEEIKLSLELSNRDSEYIEKKSQEYLSLFDLEDKKDVNPFLLSQGQKRRLSTASMMINGQRILLLDEPTYGQDRENLKKLVELLYEVNKSGVTIIMVTHDKEIIKKSCDRIVYIEDRQIKFEEFDKY